MAQSKRKRKTRARPRPADRSATKQAEQAARALVDDVFDPGVSADVSAKALLEVEAGEPVPAGLAWAIAQRSSRSRGREVAEAAAGLDPESLTTIELSARVAELEDDFGRAAEIREEALKRSDHPTIRFHLAHAYLELHRMADALELLEPLVADDPEDELVGAIYADALIEADHHLAEVGSRRPCPCGSGKRYGPCCRQREQRAVERFRDPSPLYELREALNRYSDRPELAQAVKAGVEEWISMAGRADPETSRPEIDEGRLRLLVERTRYLLPVSATSSGSSGRTILERFAEDPATPAHLTRRARDWAGMARYGLWQIAELEAGPGSLVTDILTGTRLLASIPPEMREGLPRWTVILGAMIPVDGVWRTGAATVRIGPVEGDQMANEILSETSRTVRSVARTGRGRARVGRGGAKPKRAARSPRLPQVPEVEPGTPTAALNDLRDEPASPDMAGFLSRVTASLLPSLYAEAAERAARPTAVTNTDGDALRFVTARVEVDDPDGVGARLLAHADFEPLDDEDTVAWLGREMTKTERETALAEARAFAQRRGTEVVETSGKPQRFTRGTLRFEARGISVEVNSVERLDRLVALLREIGASPRVVSRDVVDPAEEMGHLRRGGSELRPSGTSPEAAGAWQRGWVDEAVPALGGLTPRKAAADLDSRPLLESLLRELEWRWESARAGGSAVPDIEAIRAELGMEDWTAPYFEEDEPQEPSTSPDEDRRRWAVPPATGRMHDLDLAHLDPADEDDRHFLILAEHPDLWEAMDRGLDEANIGGVRMNPRLHIAMHELVANQLWHNDPAEVWETAQRLRRLGYDRHEILHMLAAAMSEETWQALRDQKPYDKRRHLAALKALPESWEKERGEAPRKKLSPRPAWRPKPVIGHGKRKRHR